MARSISNGQLEESTDLFTQDESVSQSVSQRPCRTGDLSDVSDAMNDVS